MGAYTEATRSISLEAGEDLTGDLYKFAKISSTAKLIVNDDAQAMPDGIIAEEVTSGRQSSMIMPGCIAKVKVGSVAIVVGALIAAHSDGTAVALGASNGNECCGKALQGGAAGEIISIYFAPLGQVNA